MQDFSVKTLLLDRVVQCSRCTSAEGDEGVGRRGWGGVGWRGWSGVVGCLADAHLVLQFFTSLFHAPVLR